MNIHENTALLDAFVDGELTSEEMISVQSHLDECPECRAYVDDALAIRASFPGASWQRCKVHFMRNILAYVPQKEKKSFACVLKEIWLAPTAELARKRAYDVMDT